MQLLVSHYNENKKVTYKELQTALGLKNPIEDKSAATVNNNAIVYQHSTHHTIKKDDTEIAK